MANGSTIEFRCSCGFRFRARPDQVGKSYFCPGCGKPVKITTPAESVAPVQETPVKTVQDASSSASGRFKILGLEPRIPSSVQGLLGWLLGGWGIGVLLCFALLLFSRWMIPVSLLLFAAISLGTAQQAWTLVRARQRVLTEKDVPLFWGLIRLIAWDPTEGVLILRNKAVSFSDHDLYDGVGGVRFIYPILGEEIALRIPLEVQSLHFSDQNVSTREYLNLTIRGTMKWRIVDVTKFYLLVSRELRYTNDERDIADKPGIKPPAVGKAGTTIDQLKSAAIEWLRWMAEKQTRAVAGRVSCGLLVAEQLAADVPEIRAAAGGAQPPSAAEFGSASEGLAAAINNTITEQVQEYGISIHDVSLQEIKLPEEIYRQCVEACKAAYIPVIAQREASRKRIDLQTQVELLGRESVATKEIVGIAPAYALRDFLTDFLSQRKPDAMAAVGAAIAEQATLDNGTAGRKPIEGPAADGKSSK